MSLQKWNDKYTETRLVEEGYVREFGLHCETCDEDVIVYSKWSHNKRTYIGILEGAQEIHECRSKGR